MTSSMTGRRRWRSRLGVAVLLAGLGVVALPSRAYTMSVIEIGPNLFQSILNQLNTYSQRYQDYAEYAEQAKRWYQTYQHLQQQLFRLQAFVTLANSKGLVLEERIETDGVEDCSPDGSVVSTALRWLRINRDGEIGAQQEEICRQIVIAQNRKFNETVKILRHLQQLESQWRMLEARRLLSNEQGNIEGSNNDVSRFVGQLQQDLQYWQASTEAYDSYISLLKQEQQRLAEAAMRGKRTLRGSVVQGATLKTALEAARSRDR